MSRQWLTPRCAPWGAIGSALLLVAATSAVAQPDVETLRPGAWGFDAAGQDLSSRPGDDFFKYVNGGFLRELEIPPDQSTYGIDKLLTERTDRRVRLILSETAPTANRALSKSRTLYREFMDEPRIARLGSRPLEPELKQLESIRSRDALAFRLGGGVRDFHPTFVSVSIEVDFKNPDRYVIYLNQGGLGLPDRDYYLSGAFSTQKRGYRDHIARILELIGWPEPQARAEAILNFETAIADAHWARGAVRDPNAKYHPTTLSKLQAASPGFPWRSYLQGARLPNSTQLVVREDTAIAKMATLYGQTDLETLKAWTAFHLADDTAEYLSAPFVEAHFRFYDQLLRGQRAARPRWKVGTDLVNRSLGEAVGEAYVDKYFSPAAKAEITSLVENVRAAFVARIKATAWMSPATKERALEKLAKLNVKVGYPDHWRDYADLRIDGKDLYMDVRRVKAFSWNFRASRLYGPVDRTEWFMTPQTLNAYYNPALNEIVFPAAILQAPYFDARFDPAVNYGAIGSVIGHELTHSFDDIGRRFDADGRLRDWWEPEDAARFEARAAALSRQYDAYEPYPGVRVNGRLTLGENIADLGGLLIALDAYHNVLGGRPAPRIDNLTGDQRFFLSYAQSFRAKAREDEERLRLASNPHALAPYRVNGVVRNVDTWVDEFAVKPGDRLYTPSEDRVRIW